MNIGDQDEEVEEEEEFHEVDEEKHKTSQESVSGRAGALVANNSSVNQSEPSTTIANCNDGKNVDVTTTIISSSSTVSNSITSVNEDNENESPNNEQALDQKPTLENGEASNDHDSDIKLNSSEIDKRSSSENSDASKTDSTSATTANFSTAKDSNIEISDIVDNAESQSENNAKNVDWANIMLSSTRSDKSATDEDSPSSDGPSLNPDCSDFSNKVTGDHSIDDIVAATEEKLKICDDSTPSENPVDSQADHEPINEGDREPVSEEAKVENSEDLKDVEQSEEPEKKELDMDEDVKNPQYIPKKGVFYEHDDRSHDADDKQASSSLSMDKEEDLSKSKEVANSKKVALQEKPSDNRRGNNRRQRTEADRWNHDLFRDDKQKPKSKTELINVYGYDIRQERASRNQADNRTQRSNISSSNLAQGGHDDRRSRQSKDVRPLRNNRSGNSHERKPRRQNTNNRGSSNRNEGGQIAPKRDNLNVKPKSEVRDVKDGVEEKQSMQNPSFSLNRRDREPIRNDNRSNRNDSRGRRRTSRDRPANLVDEKIQIQKPSAVMSPITVWTNEDTAIAETFKEPASLDGSSSTNVNQQQQPSQTLSQQQQPLQQQQFQQQRGRPNDNWEQNQPNKGFYQDSKIAKNPDETRHYNSRNRSYQDRGDMHRSAQPMARNQWNDRSNQHYNEWHRANNSTYGKSSDYIVKTQTFENSRLSQANMNRSNERDLRELINSRRMHGQNFQAKVGSDQHMQQHRGQTQNQIMHNQFPQQHLVQHHQQQQGTQHLLQQQQQQQHQLHQHHHHHHQQHQHQQHQPQQLTQPTGTSQQPAQNSAQSQSSPQVTQQQQQQQQQQQAQNHQRPKPVSQGQQSHQSHSRQSIVMSGNASASHDIQRLGTETASSANDLMNSRPIVKTDAYTGATVASQQQQQIPQHSQAHRVIGGPPVVQQGPTNSHLVPTHLGAGGAPAQYYSNPNNSRDPAGAASALAAAYHGYMPSGHSMMDATRYHMTSQQLSEHGYMAPGGQANVPSASVMHQQGMYADASAAGGTVASSAYLAQAGTGLSSATNIPVTGAGPPSLPPVSYLQHSQYPPPPYSNPYTQPQHNQAPAQSGHAYPPYWNYI